MPHNYCVSHVVPLAVFRTEIIAGFDSLISLAPMEAALLISLAAMEAELGFHCRFFSAQLTCSLMFLFAFSHVSGIYISNNQCTIKKDVLNLGSSLTPLQNSTTCLVSPNETFSAGFYRVGDNAYVFAIWYTQTLDRTVTWVANRDRPVNGRHSRLLLRKKDRNLLLSDADGSVVWSTNTASNFNIVKEAALLETGNLVLRGSSGDHVWESFQNPTDTLLPLQPLRVNMQLISRLGKGTFKAGYYRLYFDSYNILRLIYDDGSGLKDKYGPYGRQNTLYVQAMLNGSGDFSSNDGFNIKASDYGEGPKRRLTLDIDGNLRLYSLVEETGTWNIVWMAVSNQCRVFGFCGIYGLCISTPKPSCTCPPGFHMKDSTNWFQGCQRNHQLNGHTKLLHFPHTNYPDFDLARLAGLTLEDCKFVCMNDSRCEAFVYQMDGTGLCYPKYLLLNGFRSPGDLSHMYIKVFSNDSTVSNITTVSQPLPLNCSASTDGNKRHKKRSINNNSPLKYFAIAFGVAELFCAILGWWYMSRTYRNLGYEHLGYSGIPGGFKKFSFAELKKATYNFKIRLGEGGFGTVYRGVLSDGEVVAVKRLEGVSQGHDQFWAEVSVIGRVHHRNLVRMFGLCAEGNHRLLVYEYVENGSLDKYLTSAESQEIGNDRVLGWKERFGIAVGTAKGLAYLHEECLEWILHCDIKPQNILLDINFCPKVSDFGLAKLVDRDHSFSFSTIRGTRGYLAPEWAMNLPITAKVDVYSFGIVLLEMVTGRSSLSSSTGHLVQWVSAKMKEGREIEEVVDPRLHGDFNSAEAKRILKTAMLCVEQEKDVRPSMSQAVEMLSPPDSFTSSDSISPNDSAESFPTLPSSSLEVESQQPAAESLSEIIISEPKSHHHRLQK